MIRYELIREIGRGGMGMVYEARMLLPLGEEMRVAIKRAQGLGSQEMEMFLREAMMSLHINNDHPNLITTHNFGMSRHGPYLVMEFVDGVSLCALAKSDKLEYAHIRRIAFDTLDALAHLHGHDVVHRDVSPGNILISREGVIKVADLGLVKAMDASHSGRFRGTTAYASPEALQGAGAGARSDLYSLGVVLYELVTRMLPYGSGEPTRVFGNMTAGPPAPLPEETPEDLARLITGMMALDSEKRAFASANGAIAFLDLHGEPVADDAELGGLVEGCMQTRRADADREMQGTGNPWPVLEEIDPLDEMLKGQQARRWMPRKLAAMAGVVVLLVGLAVVGGIQVGQRLGAGAASVGATSTGGPVAGAARGGLDGLPAAECAPAGPAPCVASDAARSGHAPGPDPGEAGQGEPSGAAQSKPVTPRKRSKPRTRRASATPAQAPVSDRPLFYRVPPAEPGHKSR